MNNYLGFQLLRLKCRSIYFHINVRTRNCGKNRRTSDAGALRLDFHAGAWKPEKNILDVGWVGTQWKPTVKLKIK